MRLNKYGVIAKDQWRRSEQIREEIKLDEFIIMPNHLHGIVFIENTVGANGRSPLHRTEFLLYTTPNGKVKVEIFLRDENLWLTQARIADLFGVERSVVTKHLQNIFQEGELDRESTCAKIAQVQTEGAGKVSAEIAKSFAENEFEKYSVIRDGLYESDFDQAVKKLMHKEKRDYNKR